MIDKSLETIPKGFFSNFFPSTQDFSIGFAHTVHRGLKQG